MNVLKKASSKSEPDRTETEVPAPRAKATLRQLQTLPEQIAELIFNSIADGEYEPGERIREEALAEQFEVSRGPVREALRILEKDSVVRILPNRGAHVTQLSIKEVADIFEIRRKLSSTMIARLSADEAARLAAVIDADVRALDSLALDPDGSQEYFQISFRLSRVLRESCTNERLAEILASLSRQTLRYTQLGLATPARRKESARNWKSMHKAMKAGNVDAAAEAVEKLIEDSQREAIRQLEARQGTGSAEA
ncbi:GntR family transcriptional regulator [Variovorax sp. J31P179]|uniref:GntR family transcriptional regulator n=1 Tax=Variovorax sp. J31P179 TaxID=3053508 RepID=UPI00257504FC|nr:GntR family transcriptional regulator [Variovorax sp. J31P179]MDM0085425.1 GntR family transcriptional regulator [Variovorax sp. J31P179]